MTGQIGVAQDCQREIGDLFGAANPAHRDRFPECARITREHSGLDEPGAIAFTVTPSAAVRPARK